ncbi:MAG: hypothetical protein KGZ25_11285 [Planctomycetes bacterium]|nr:hypothetical protein [Planctomycetota bacterium]
MTEEAPMNIGGRRELFVDRQLIEEFKGDAERRLQHPTPKNIVIEPESPWEQDEGALGYITVFKDDGLYRMYYKGGMMRDFPSVEDDAFGIADIIICYAESTDGIHWDKPNLGIHEFQGSCENNIVWKGRGSHGFAPFIDTRPGCPEEERYKAIGTSKTDVEPKPGGTKYLFVLSSSDGLHWSPTEGPKEHGAILDQHDGDFDSQNVAFWDEHAGCYRLYFRRRRDVKTRPDLADREDGEGYHDVKPRVRDIKTATSDDCLRWSAPDFLNYPGAPDEELYTNQIIPYPRAPHILLGFPTRYVEGRGPLTEWHEKMAEKKPGRTYISYTDGLLMSSRDGETFHRWGEAFLRPRMPEDHLWCYGACYQNHGLVETDSDIKGAPREFSLYACERYRSNPRIRRHTIRLDGFVSVNAPLSGGELVTKPITFDGEKLFLNMATSAAGSIQVEIQDPDGSPLPDFGVDNCVPLFGNAVTKEVDWKGQRGLSELAGQEVRLKFLLKDADLFALQFG